MEHDEIDWLSAEQLAAWMPLSAALLILPTALDRQLQRDSGISFFTYLVMAALSDSTDRTLRMSDLATVASGSLSRLSHTVKKLERRGWVTRRPDPDDARSTLATLTDAGWDAIVAAAPGHVAEVRRLIVDVLPPEQLRELGTALRAVVLPTLPTEGPVRSRFDG